MEKNQKNLKEISVILLILAAISLASLIVDIALNGFTVTNVPDGLSEALVKAVMVITVVVGFVTLIPRAYVGYKGVKMSTNPDKSRAHIVWAKVLFVFAIISVISHISDFSGNADKLLVALNLGCAVIDAVLYFFYIKFANLIYRAV